MCVLLIKRLLLGMGRWVRKTVKYTSWVAVVTPTDRPKSVQNYCVIELFVALFVLSLCLFDISIGVGAFVLGLSQISSFFAHISDQQAVFSSISFNIKYFPQIAQYMYVVYCCYNNTNVT